MAFEPAFGILKSNNIGPTMGLCTSRWRVGWVRPCNPRSKEARWATSSSGNHSSLDQAPMQVQRRSITPPRQSDPYPQLQRKNEGSPLARTAVERGRHLPALNSKTHIAIGKKLAEDLEGQFVECCRLPLSRSRRGRTEHQSHESHSCRQNPGVEQRPPLQDAAPPLLAFGTKQRPVSTQIPAPHVVKSNH